MMSKPFDLRIGDCLESLKSMPDNSVDSCVTDPPYGLSQHSQSDIVKCLQAWLSGEKYEHGKSGFMGKKWDSFCPGPEVWREVLRVLKPGGHVLAFAGTRSMDLMSMAIRLAGFELRDAVGYAHDGGGAPLLAYCYGSGFPKSLDVSKAIDKTGGASVAWFGPWFRVWREGQGLSQKEVCERCGFYGEVNRGGAVANWELGLSMPTPEQFNLIRDMFGLPFESIEAAQREVIGKKKAAPGVAFSSEGPTELDITAPATDAARQWQGWGTALKPAWEPIILARKPLDGTVAANVLQHGTGAINVDGCRVHSEDSQGYAYSVQRMSPGADQNKTGKTHQDDVAFEGHTKDGRWPANLILQDCEEVKAGFPESKSGGVNGVRKGGDNNCMSGGNQPRVYTDGRAPDAGSSARFFKQVSPDAEDLQAARFMYCAKASRADRNAGLKDPGPQFTHGTTLRKVENTDTNGNHHPTVKPTDLMAYLVRLVTPHGGVVLDPFMGSGSTGKACMREGFNFIGCELDPEYLEIARARIQHELDVVTAANAPKPQADLFA